MLPYVKLYASTLRQFGKRFGHLLAVCSIVISSAGLVVGTKAWSSRRNAAALRSQAPATAAQSESMVARAGDEPPRVEVIRITVRPTGFEPSEISYPARPFVLAFDNQSGLETLELKLESVAGNSARAVLREVKMPKGRLRNSQVTSLHPGRYVVEEARHPEWSCRITITPQ